MRRREGNVQSPQTRDPPFPANSPIHPDSTQRCHQPNILKYSTTADADDRLHQVEAELLRSSDFHTSTLCNEYWNRKTNSRNNQLGDNQLGDNRNSQNRKITILSKMATEKCQAAHYQKSNLHCQRQATLKVWNENGAQIALKHVRHAAFHHHFAFCYQIWDAFEWKLIRCE